MRLTTSLYPYKGNKVKRILVFLLLLIAMPAFATFPQSNSTSNARSDATASNSVNVGGSPAYGSEHNFYILPSPMFAPQLPTINSPCANASQKGGAFLFGVMSAYEGGISTDNCVAIEMYNAAIKSCRYKTAGQIMELLTVKVLPNFKPAQRDDLIDLDTRACGAHSRPVQQQAVLPATDVVFIPSSDSNANKKANDCIVSAVQSCRAAKKAK